MNGNSDSVHRPRPRKPVHTQLIRTVSSSSIGNALADGQGVGQASATSSGRSTPVPADAPPSVKSLSSARKQVRAEDQQRRRRDQQRQLQQLQQGRRLFPTVEFASRVSHFDPASDYRDFHGFFNLFWIGLAIMAITTMLRNIKDTGLPLRVHTWELFTANVWEMALADAAMVASTAVSLPLHRALRRAALADADDLAKEKLKVGGARGGTRITWARGGMLIQSLYQAAWLAMWIAVPFLRDWTWTAQVFLLLHTMVLLMKMHSYAFYNGHLSETERRLRALDHPATASKAPAYLYPASDTAAATAALGPDANPNGLPTKTMSPPAPVPTAPPLEGGSGSEKETTVQDETGHLLPPPASAATGTLTAATDHGVDEDATDSESESDEAAVLRLRTILARELTSPLGNVTYPRNLTWSNYVDYLVCPTLCYELEYPRTPGPIRVREVVSKVLAIFGCIFLLYVTSEEFILPVLADASLRLEPVRGSFSLDEMAGGGGQNITTLGKPVSPADALLILAESISWMLFPFMLTFLLVFLVIFEYVLGAMAELSRFADRRFYGDWWNSTDWMEFSREWNVPVYSFLRRHVYGASRPHLGRAPATAITFLISALGHEIVMGCITKKVRGYGFVAQMLQLPIVMLQRTKWVRGRRTLNNVCFWCSMIMGLSMMCSLYVLV